MAAMQRIPVLAALIAVAAAIACAGCSRPGVSGPPPGDEGINAFVVAYNAALNNGSAQQRWDMTCSSQREWFDANPVRKTQLKESVPGRLEITQINAHGDTAQVAVNHIDGTTTDRLTLHLVREEGTWKLCEK